MTIDVGLRYPHKFAGLVGISGWVFELENLLKELSSIAREQRLLVTHGPFDAVIPFDKVREQIQKLKAEKFNVEWREFPKAHTIYGEAELAVIREFVRAGYSNTVK
jgi:phospholipase/carboxylesterase